MTATVEKGAGDKANPTGEAKAAKLIAWFNAGAGGKIQWGKPGDFRQCTLIAGKHMTPSQAAGFCALRHKDATGFRPGQAPAERVGKAGRLAVLRRLLSLHPAAKAQCPSCESEVSAFAGSCPACGTRVGVEAKKAIDGVRTYDEKRELIGRALKLAYTVDDDSYIYVRDLTDALAIFELSGKDPDAGMYRVPYSIDDWNHGDVSFGDPEPVELRTEYVPKVAKSEDVPVLKAVAGPVIKSVDAKRYTMAPLYPASPESPSAAHLDAHGDFATAEDLQAAVWDYVRKGDRTIRDQHRDGTAIGEWVEIISWPYEVTVPMTTAAGATVQKSFAPGTVFLGVVWNDLGWSDITKGVKTGYSLGGSNYPLIVEMQA